MATGNVFINKGTVVGDKIGGGTSADEMTYTNYQALTSKQKNDGSLRIVTEYPSPYDDGLVPKDYQQVEYIEATGDQYIDTGVSAPNGYRAKLDINFTAYNSDGSYGVVIGNYDNAPHRNFLGRGKNTVMVGVNGYTTVDNPMPNNNEWYDVEFCTTTDSSKKSYLKVGNTVAWENNGAIGGNTLCSDNLFLFQAKQTVYISAKVRSVKIYNSTDELVRDFVPCYRKTDAEVGLYDTVTGQFYTKARGSALLKGEDITSTGNLNVLIRNEVVVGQLTNIIDNDSKSGTRTWGADKLDEKFTEIAEEQSAMNTNLGDKSEASAVIGDTAFAKINSLNGAIPKILIDVFERVEITNKYPAGRYLSILAFVDRGKATGLLSNVTQLQINFTNTNITLEYCDLQDNWHTVWNK